LFAGFFLIAGIVLAADAARRSAGRDAGDERAVAMERPPSV
jgi:hypothetical protein